MKKRVIFGVIRAFLHRREKKHKKPDRVGSGEFPAEKKDRSVRWTGVQDRNADFAHVVQVINQKTGLALTVNDFILQESRDLAFNKYSLYQQLSEQRPAGPASGEN